MIRQSRSLVLMLLLAVAASAAFLAPGRAYAQASPQQAQVAQPAQKAGDGFEPVANLPDPVREQLPAAPMVMVAYAFVWAMVIGYVWSLWRRLAAVERELKAVSQRIEEAGRR
jgi:CcmD family protein